MEEGKSLKIEDLHFRRIGRGKPAGSHQWHGRTIKDSVFCLEYETRVGTFSPEEWNKLAMQTVKDTGLYELYLAVFNHCKTLAWLHTDAEYREHALECMTFHAYEKWDNNEEIMKIARRIYGKGTDNGR